MDIKPKHKTTTLKELRELSGFSQKELAIESGIDVRVLQNYEQGVRDLNGAKLITLLKLCKVLHCKLQDLVSESDAINLLNEIYPTEN